MINRAIAHMDLDSFFVSAERLYNSRLLGKPVIIGGTTDRGVVTSCSYEARAFGVHSAMPIKRARQLCPDAYFIRGDIQRYVELSRAVTDIIKSKVPLYQKSSIDEFYLDLTGMDRFFGCYRYATEVRETIERETGLPISFGLSTSKAVSKMATGHAKPHGQMQVEAGYEKTFLAPLPVDKIPMAGKRLCQQLQSMGITHIRHLQAMDRKSLENALGRQGVFLWKRANGIDNSTVEPYRESKSMSTERTFSKNTTDIGQLQSILVAMAEKLAFKLRESNRLTSCVAIKVRFSNFETHTMQASIPYTNCDHTIIQNVKELFRKQYRQAYRSDTTINHRKLPIRLVGVRLSHLTEGGYQINLFEDTQEMVALYQAMDRIRQRFGSGAVARAVSTGVGSGIPAGDLRLMEANPFQAA